MLGPQNPQAEPWTCYTQGMLHDLISPLLTLLFSSLKKAIMAAKEIMIALTSVPCKNATHGFLFFY